MDGYTVCFHASWVGTLIALRSLFHPFETLGELAVCVAALGASAAALMRLFD